MQIDRLWRGFGWLGVLLTLVLSLMPPLGPQSETHGDKIVHLIGYAILMFWWAQLVIQRRWQLALAIVVFGLVIEGLQGLSPNRQPDLADALANSLGVGLGWLAARPSPNLPQRLTALFAPRG